MADQKITQLTALTAPTTDDLLAIVDDPAGTPVTKKITLANLLTLFVSNVVVQTLTSASATYTPTAGMKKALVIACGPGGNGAAVTGADDAGGGGGGGGTSIRLVSAADIGTSIPYTVGQTSGNTTNFGTSPILAQGASGSNGSATGNTAVLGAQAAGGAGGTAGSGDLNIPGESGQRAVIYSGTAGCGGAGGCSVFGNGGAASGSEAAGNNGTAYGGGGGGAHTATDVDRSGGTGAAGVIYVIEFLD